MRKILVGSILYLFFSVNAFTQAEKNIWLDDLPIQSFSSSIRPVQAKTNYAHDSLMIKGNYYQRGVGAQSVCVFSFYLDKQAKRFTALVGADDKGNKDIPIKFYVVADGKTVFESGEMRIGDAPKKVDVGLTGVVQLGLLVTDDVGGITNKRTYCDWANAQLTMLGDHLPGHLANDGKKYILTPLPAKSPKINSAKIFGATPGNPVLYTVAATGERPIHFSANNLPKGLSLDPSTGMITGKIDQRGTYITTLKAKNKFGEAKKKIKNKDRRYHFTYATAWMERMECIGWSPKQGKCNGFSECNGNNRIERSWLELHKY